MDRPTQQIYPHTLMHTLKYKKKKRNNKKLEIEREREVKFQGSPSRNHPRVCSAQHIHKWFKERNK